MLFPAKIPFKNFHKRSVSSWAHYSSRKFTGLESDLKGFLGSQENNFNEYANRLLVIEQEMVAPTGPVGEYAHKAIAPRDAATGMLLLSKAHQFVDNLPSKYEKRGLDAAKYLKGVPHRQLGRSWRGAEGEQSGSAGA